MGTDIVLNGYDTASLSTLSSVSASATVEFEWNANDFANPIIFGTSSVPSPSDFSGRVQSITGIGSTVVTTLTASYANTASGGKNSTHNDGSYYLARNTNINKPVNLYAILNVSDLLTTTEKNSQDSYSYVVSFWVKTPYGRTLSTSGVSETLNISVNCTALGSNSTIINVANRATISKTVNSSDWEQVVIEFDHAVPSTIGVQYVKLEINTNSQLNYSTEILIDQIQVFDISTYQARHSNPFTSVKELFRPYRPGEYLVKYKENGITLGTRTDQPNHFVPSPMLLPISYNNSKYISINDDQYFKTQDSKNFIPYVTKKIPSDSADGNNIMWSLYDDNFNINKIVVKQNRAAPDYLEVIPTISASILQKSGATYTWVDVGSNITVNNNGISILYWNGSAWSETKWTSTPNISTGSVSGSPVTICGIAVKSNIGNVGSNAQFVEISPRLTVDLSNFLESYSILKEMSDDSDPLPIGQATSNVLSLTLNNFPIINLTSDAPSYVTQTDVIAFNDGSKTSPFYQILKRGISCFLQLTLNGITVPQFSGYINTIKSSEDNTQFEIFDIIKRLQEVNLPASRSVFSRMSIQEAVQQTLRAAGINDFDRTLPGLSTLSNFQSTINYYWIENNENALSALDELAKIYQIAFWADEYGKIQITVPPTVNTSGSINMYLNDIAVGTAQPNIVSLQENNIGIPKTLSISYDIPSVAKNPTGLTVSTAGTAKGAEIVSYSKQHLWQPQELIVLSNVELGKNFLVGDNIMALTNNTSFLNRSLGYNGYYLIDDEVISFNGKQYDFYCSTSSLMASIASAAYILYSQNPITIYSAEQLDKVISDIRSASPTVTAVAHKDRNTLAEVSRGLFGTKESDHIIDSINWKYTPSPILYTFTTGASTTIFDLYAPKFGPLAVSTSSVIVKDGAVIVPANRIFAIDYPYSIQTVASTDINKHNYFKALIKLGLPTDTASPTGNSYCGIVFNANPGNNNSLWIGVGSHPTALDVQQVVIKAFDSTGKLTQSLLFSENSPTASSQNAGFGDQFINLSEPILFETWLQYANNGSDLYAKIAINGFLFTNYTGVSLYQTAFNNIKIAIPPTGSLKNYLKIDTDLKKSSNFGIFHWSSGSTSTTATPTPLHTTVYEILFGNVSNISGIGYRQDSTTIGFEKTLANTILNNMNTPLESGAHLSSQPATPNFFYWTGSKNAREIKLFDINIEQKPIFNSNINIYTAKYGIPVEQLLQNYIN